MTDLEAMSDLEALAALQTASEDSRPQLGGHNSTQQSENLQRGVASHGLSAPSTQPVHEPRTSSYQFRTFADTLGSDSNHRFANVQKFLRGREIGAALDLESTQSSQMVILDHTGDHLHKREALIPRKGSIDLSFRAFLQGDSNIHTASKLKILLWQTGYLSPLNPSYLDYIALEFNLQPEFISAHLEKRSHSREIYHIHYEVPIPSKKQYLQIVEDQFGFASLTWTKYQGVDTVIVIGQNSGPEKEVEQLWKYWFEVRDSAYLRTLVESPINVIFPYVENVLQRAATNIAYHTPLESPVDISAQDISEWTMHDNWAVLHLWSTNLQALRQECMSFQTNICSKYRFPDASFTTVIRNLDELIAQARLQSDSIRTRLDMILQSKTSRQSHSSLKEASSTRRLSLLASIFLPLNFATSFLGMNLRQLNGGSVGIGYFIWVSVIAGVLSGIILITESSLGSQWSRVRQSVFWEYDGETDDVPWRDVARALYHDKKKQVVRWWRSRAPKKHTA